jgi:hypothetical protein
VWGVTVLFSSVPLLLLATCMMWVPAAGVPQNPIIIIIIIIIIFVH